MELTQERFRLVIAARAPWDYERAIEFYDGNRPHERNNVLVYSKTPDGKELVRKYFEERGLQLLIDHRGDVFVFNPKECKGPELIMGEGWMGGPRIHDDRKMVRVDVNWYRPEVKPQEPLLPGGQREQERLARSLRLATVANVSSLG